MQLSPSLIPLSVGLCVCVFMYSTQTYLPLDLLCSEFGREHCATWTRRQIERRKRNEKRNRRKPVKILIRQMHTQTLRMKQIIFRLRWFPFVSSLVGRFFCIAATNQCLTTKRLFEICFFFLLFRNIRALLQFFCVIFRICLRCRSGRCFYSHIKSDITASQGYTEQSRSVRWERWQISETKTSFAQTLHKNTQELHAAKRRTETTRHTNSVLTNLLICLRGSFK